MKRAQPRQHIVVAEVPVPFPDDALRRVIVARFDDRLKYVVCTAPHFRAVLDATLFQLVRTSIENIVADILCITQAAVSHQVKLLEERLGAPLFMRVPRGLRVTAEGEALLPAVTESFDRMADLLERFDGGYVREVLNVRAVGTFAVGWLLPRLPRLRERHPHIELRLSTNNNRVDIASEGLDYAIRFGNGAWHDTQAEPLFEAPLSVLCLPQIAAPCAARRTSSPIPCCAPIAPMSGPAGLKRPALAWDRP